MRMSGGPRARGVVQVTALNVWNPLGLDVGDPVATAVSLGVAAAGGFAFQSMGVPLPWILGSMFACTVASLSGARDQTLASSRRVIPDPLGLLHAQRLPYVLRSSSFALWLRLLGLGGVRGAVSSPFTYP